MVWARRCLGVRAVACIASALGSGARNGLSALSTRGVPDYLAVALDETVRVGNAADVGLAVFRAVFYLGSVVSVVFRLRRL